MNVEQMLRIVGLLWAAGLRQNDKREGCRIDECEWIARNRYYNLTHR